MALSAFSDKSCEPQPEELRAVLGRSAARWGELVSHFEAAFAPLALDWNFGGAKWGWILRLKQKKRTVLYLTPCKRHFIAGFALGQKAVDAARAIPLDTSVLAVIDAAPKYPEGRGVRIEVRTKRDAEYVKQLADVKMSN